MNHKPLELVKNSWKMVKEIFSFLDPVSIKTHTKT